MFRVVGHAYVGALMDGGFWVRRKEADEVEVSWI